VGGLTATPGDHLNDSIKICVNIRIPETQYPKTVLLEMRIAYSISLSVESVLPAVDFDDESGAEANKVNNIIVDRRLPPKMNSEFAQFA
jgi:hypothetical protein